MDEKKNTSSNFDKSKLNEIPVVVAPLKIPDFDKKIFSETTVATNEKTNQEPTKDNTQKSATDYVLRGVVFLFLAILLLVAVFAVYNYADLFLKTGTKAVEQKLVFENELVRADRSRVVSLEAGASKEQVRSIIIEAMANEKVGTGEISLVMPSYLRDTTINGTRQLVSELQRGDDFFFTFAPRSPLNLRTIAAEKYAIGTAGVGNVDENGTKNFFVFSVSSAPDATREMLTWENQIYNDMRTVLKLREIHGSFYFKDLSDNNHLLRVGYDDDGVIMVYGYGGPKTIIVAPDAETFQQVYLHLK